MNNHYKNFLIQKAGYEGAFEHEHGFLLYKTLNDPSGNPVEVRIGEIYVDPAYRQSGIAKDLADRCEQLARDKGLKYLSCMTHLTGQDDRLSMLAILHYGFEPKGAHGNEVVFLKEIK